LPRKKKKDGKHRLQCGTLSSIEVDGKSRSRKKGSGGVHRLEIRGGTDVQEIKEREAAERKVSSSHTRGNRKKRCKLSKKGGIKACSLDRDRQLGRGGSEKIPEMLGQAKLDGVAHGLRREFGLEKGYFCFLEF